MLRALAAAGFLCVFAHAQEEVSSKDTQAIFNAHVNLVMVPVVVRDKSGNTIGTLKKEDFQLFDRGKLQFIARFAMEKASDRIKPTEVPDDDSEVPNNSGEPPKTVILPARFIAYVFDDLHLDIGDLTQARKAASKYLAESLRPDERIAIYTTSGRVMLDFTSDLTAIGEAMNRIVPKIDTTDYDCPPISFYQADLIVNKNDPTATQVALADVYKCNPGLVSNLPAPGGSASPDQQTAMAEVNAGASRTLQKGEQDSTTALGVLKDIARRMSASPGERTLVIISSGFYLTDFERRAEVEVIDRAIRSNVTVNAIDARGLYTFIPGGDASTSSTNRAMDPGTATQRASLQRDEQLIANNIVGELAEGTGGRLFLNSNDLKAGFATLTRPPEYIYYLGFSPQNLKLDGSYHSLKVSLTQKGFTLVARRGYYAPQHEQNRDELARDEIREALFSREEMQDIPLQFQTQFFKTSDQKARVSVITKIDLKPLHFHKEDGREKDSLTIVAGVFDKNGNLITAIQKTVDMRLKEETFEQRLNSGILLKTSLDIPPGDYVVRVVLRDLEGQLMTARNRVVQIPY